MCTFALRKSGSNNSRSKRFSIETMIKTILLVGGGSCIGGICRYLLSSAFNVSSTSFPLGTYIVNTLGCLLIGVFWALSVRHQFLSPSIATFLMTGFCGGFTTFSTFSKESLGLLQANDFVGFSLYTIGGVALGLLAVWVGYKAVEAVVM